MATPNQSTLSQDAEHMLDDFDKPPVTHDEVTNLRNAIASSPVLIEQINTTVEKGYLKGFALETNPRADAGYNRHTRMMNLLPGDLSNANILPADLRKRKGHIVFTLGHETQHSHDRADIIKANLAFANAVKSIAGNYTIKVHDYTQPLGLWLTSQRWAEARGVIAGCNALVSMVKAENPNLAQLYNDTDPKHKSEALGKLYEASPDDMAYFIVRSDSKPFTYTLKPGLQFDANMEMGFTQDNMEMMGQYYSDQAVMLDQPGLGTKAYFDYANYYAPTAIKVIVQAEQAAREEARKNHLLPPGQDPPQVVINMSNIPYTGSSKHATLLPQVLENNGLNLGCDASFLIYDSSTSITNPTPLQLRNTNAPSTCVPGDQPHDKDNPAHPPGAAKDQPTENTTPTPSNTETGLDSGVNLQNKAQTTPANPPGQHEEASPAQPTTGYPCLDNVLTAKTPEAFNQAMEDLYQSPFVQACLAKATAEAEAASLAQQNQDLQAKLAQLQQQNQPSPTSPDQQQDTPVKKGPAV